MRAGCISQGPRKSSTETICNDKDVISEVIPASQVTTPTRNSAEKDVLTIPMKAMMTLGIATAKPSKQ